MPRDWVLNRDRAAATGPPIGRASPEVGAPAGVLVGKVVKGPAYPAPTPPPGLSVVLVRPFVPWATEAEGIGAARADREALVPTVVVGNVPPAATVLHAHLIDGLWVAEYRGPYCARPDTATVRLRKQCDGSPVSGARWTLLDASGVGGQHPPFGCAGTTAASGTTGDDGTFSFTYIPFRHYCLKLEADWTHGTCTGTFDFFEGSDCNGVDLEFLLCTGRVSFTVTDRDSGAPISGILAGPIGGPDDSNIAFGAGYYPAVETHFGCMPVGSSPFGTESPAGTYLFDQCNRWAPAVGDCLGHCPIRFTWDVSHPGYLDCCGVGEFSCGADTPNFAVSLQKIDPDWVKATNRFGFPCCGGACIGDPYNPKCGPEGRVIKKTLRAIFHSADHNVFGSFDGVPVNLPYFETPNPPFPPLQAWGGCFDPGDGTDFLCRGPSDRRVFPSTYIKIGCSGGGSFAGTYTKYTGHGCTHVGVPCPGGGIGGSYEVDYSLSRTAGSICHPASASGVVFVPFSGVVGTVEILE